MVVVSKEGLAISACKVPTPYGQGNRILAFSVELINQTDQPIEFLPKDIFLFDQLNRQFPPLPPEALIEASVTDSNTMHGYVGFGWGGGGWRDRYYGSFMTPISPFGPSPYDWNARPEYQGIVSSALQLKPSTIYAHARVRGNIYFAASIRSVDMVDIKISRFVETPKQNMPEPRSLEYEFKFEVR